MKYLIFLALILTGCTSQTRPACPFYGGYADQIVTIHPMQQTETTCMYEVEVKGQSFIQIVER